MCEAGDIREISAPVSIRILVNLELLEKLKSFL